MATFYQANVTATNGSAFVTVNSSADDIGILRERSFLQIGTNRIVEVKAGIPGSPDQIELAAAWPFSTVTADAIAGPTAGDLAEAVEQIRSLNSQAGTILAEAAQLSADQVFTGTNHFSQGVRVGSAADTQITRGSAGQINVAGSRAYLRNNILGPVSQSGGVPTGAVIERGSNANGEYVKWADGTMICYLVRECQAEIDARLSNLTEGDTGTFTWTLPATFVNTASISAQANWGSSGGAIQITGQTQRVSNWTASSIPINWEAMAAVGGAAQQLQAIAVGRYY